MSLSIPAATISRDLRLTPTQVPPKETTYYCQLFDLNLTSDLHMVATQPLLNVSDVVHHVLMFGCDPKGRPVCYKFATEIIVKIRGYGTNLDASLTSLFQFVTLRSSERRIFSGVGLANKICNQCCYF